MAAAVARAARRLLPLSSFSSAHARAQHAAAGGPELRIGAATDLGRMRVNEDRFFVGRAKGWDMVGVFDGHSGDVAVRYVTEHLMAAADEALSTSNPPATAMRNIFKTLSTGLYTDLTAAEEVVVDHLRSGTTCSLALLSGNEVVIGHVGDSRMLLCRGGEAVPLTRQHRPDDPDELARVAAAGGRVTFVGVPRVNGQLAMTRAIGAFHLANQGVVADPDVRELELDPALDAFMVLGTDGLFDVMCDDEVIATVMQAESPADAANALSELALAHGARDNITAVVVALPAWHSSFAMPEIASRNFTRRAS